MVDKEFKRVACEVYSRVVGYIRPISAWNPGKVSEYKDRKLFKIKQDGKNKNIRS